MISTYSKKTIKVTVVQPDELGGETIVIENAPIDCQITKSGGQVFAQANIDIYGLELATMNKLLYDFERMKMLRMKITVQAGEVGKKLPIVFVGEIMFAYFDLNNATPVMHIDAQTGCFDALMKLKPLEFSGEWNAQDIFETIVGKTGLFSADEANKFIGKIKDLILNGDPISMLRALAEAFRAFLILDDESAFMLNNGDCRITGGSIPLIEPDSGMIGYPVITRIGVNCSMYFRPELKIAERVNIYSPNIKPAGKFWQLIQLTHTLSANNPNTQAWRTDIACASTGQIITQSV